MPSKSDKQRKTMSAIAHGWKPEGKAADIPVGVAKEFHAADKGKKYGKGGKGGAPVVPPAKGPAPPMGKGESKPNYDRSSHFQGNPGFAKGQTGAMPHSCATPTHSLGLKHTPSQGFGHSVVNRSGCLRLSGHSGAHRIGKR